MQSFRKRLSKLKRREGVPQVSCHSAINMPSNQERASDIEIAQNPPVQEPSSQDPTLATARTKLYGLFLLNKNEPPIDSKDLVGVDIVAIHGLNGDAYTTWQHDNGTLWLRDLLPSALPGSRVFTYGYPSELFWSNSVATLRDYARNLLMSLRAVSEGKQRPIIFVCHSLGGIVCKQASTPLKLYR
jgi:hypothetical protein